MRCSRLLLLVVVLGAPGASVGAQDDNIRRVTVTVGENGFEPRVLELRQNDLVQVTFVAADAPHAFLLDAYRIAKRATPGRPSTFEFRADQIGRFNYYCSLASANGQTHDERGELIVRR